MLNTDHYFTMEFYSKGGKSLGQLALDADFAPACEWTRLAGIRKGELAPAEYDRQAMILPLWHSKLSQPYLSGFRVQIRSNGSKGYSCDFSNVYFKQSAAEALELFIKAGKLRTGDRFIYLLAAFPRQPDCGGHEKARFIIEDVAAAIPIREGIIEELKQSAALQGVLDLELPSIFLPTQVLSEAAALAHEAGQSETGGFLIGHLYRDRALPEIFAEVTAQIPAAHTVGELAKLTFTSETWTAAMSAIALRQKGETLLGWWHSHPVDHWKCRDCPEDKRQTCIISQGFFSEQDRMVHRTVFSRAWSMALVVSELADGVPSFSMFGWNRGTIEPRGYYLLNAGSAAVESKTAIDQTSY